MSVVATVVRGTEADPRNARLASFAVKFGEPSPQDEAAIQAAVLGVLEESRANGASAVLVLDEVARGPRRARSCAGRGRAAALCR
jgi:hypothetical protein